MHVVRIATPGTTSRKRATRSRIVRFRSGLRIRVSTRLTRDVPPELATATFRIFQEAITNAVRHSGASTVIARLTMAKRELMLYVRDNGVGITEERLHSGMCLGLLGMRERARALGGDVQIKGKPGHGTILAMTLPLGTN